MKPDNIIKFLELLKSNSKLEQIIKNIFNSLDNPSISIDQLKNYIIISIDGFIEFFKNNDENCFYKISKQIIEEIGIPDTNIGNVIRTFNIFLLALLKDDINLNHSDILNFIKAQNLFILHFSDYYHRKVVNILKEEKENIYMLNERILQSMTTGLLVLDNKLNILKANEAFFKIADIDKFDITGMNLKDILTDRKGIPIDKLKEKCLIKGGLSETSLFVTRKNGKTYHRTLKAEILYDKNKNPEGFIVHITDTDFVNYLKETFSKYLSKQIAEKIINEKGINLNGEKKRVAVMFIDIRNFTNFAENNPPEIVLTTLNNYFDVIIDTVFEFNGKLDKFIGDAVMVVFGAPIESKNDIENALNCAIEIQKKIKMIQKNFKYSLSTGIGINFGNVIAGNIGSEKRIEYTVIGDTVNTANKIQKITPGGKIYVSESVVNNVENFFKFNFIDERFFKGKFNSVKIFELIQE